NMRHSGTPVLSPPFNVREPQKGNAMPPEPSSPPAAAEPAAANANVTPTQPVKPPKRRKWLRIGVLCAVVLIAMVFGISRIIQALTTVSTDDAFVNGHVTFAAPRVGGQVKRVLVDDNDRVKKGDLLVELDKEPFQVQLDIKKAALEAAETDLVAAQAH